jgi:hypothetical protein
MILGLVYKPESVSTALAVLPEADDIRQAVLHFIVEFPEYIKEVLTALAAIVVFFAVFQLATRRYQLRQMGRIAVGFVYTFIGLVIFLTGVNVGFLPCGQLFGQLLAISAVKWILIPLGMLIGWFIVAAEPAVLVLRKQVEDVTQGAIPQKMLSTALSIGMSLALGLTMTRILFGFHLMWILIPGYFFSLVLTFVVPKIFTGIAFDSGGVCSGPLTSTFLLPLAMGVSAGIGADLMSTAFGIVAMVAMTPLIVLQLMGLLYMARQKKAAARAQLIAPSADMSGITEYEIRGYTNV